MRYLSSKLIRGEGGRGKIVVLLASEWATLLQCLRTWKNFKPMKCEPRKEISFARWQNWARGLHPGCKAWIKTDESPSNITLSSPISTASSNALLAAKTSITKYGKGISCDGDAITKPQNFWWQPQVLHCPPFQKKSHRSLSCIIY